MAGTTQALQALFAFLLSALCPQPSVCTSYHLTATCDREISLPSGVLGTEMLKLRPQRAH